jgi:uncharacterized protein (TIGR03067 family)
MLVSIRNSLILGVLVSLPAYADQPPEDIPQLQGVWACVQAFEDGRTFNPKSDEELTVTFTKTRMFFSSSLIESDRESEFTADSSKNPTQIDVTPIRGPFKGKKHMGIYELKQNQLKLCLPKRPLSERPAKFEASKDSLLQLSIFKRLE